MSTVESVSTLLLAQNTWATTSDFVKAGTISSKITSFKANDQDDNIFKTTEPTVYGKAKQSTTLVFSHLGKSAGWAYPKGKAEA